MRIPDWLFQELVIFVGIVEVEAIAQRSLDEIVQQNARWIARDCRAHTGKSVRRIRYHVRPREGVQVDAAPIVRDLHGTLHG